MTNTLYYGDNLDILRRYVKDGSVDLVYLDPPFKSSQNYNVLFKEQDGTRAASQIHAFEDTWTWDQEDEATFAELVTAGGRVADVMQAFRTFLGPCDMMAYLVMMCPRLVELHRVMRSTASIYLHCDPAASHYLKLLMDAVFGPNNFRTELVWKRSSAHSDTKQGRKQHGRIHDIVLFYTKTDDWTWNPLYTPYDQEYIDAFYRHVEPGTGRRYRLSDLTAAKPGGDTSYEWKGVKPYRGRYWAYSRENMEAFVREGRLVYSKSGMPSYKRYLDEMPGVPLQDLWTDIRPIGASAAERLGYPTQKPEVLLERIIQASSNKEDLVLDPFCGCGTTVAAAQKLKRRWIGIDITYLAMTLMKQRIKDAFGVSAEYAVVGEPVSLPDAEALANSDPYQFQWWALGLVDARPVDPKKGADRGIDGKIVFQGDEAGKFETVIISVKAGSTGVSHVRDLRGVMDRENAAIGVLITMHNHTAPMKKEAATAGFFESISWGQKYPKIQLLKVADLLDGKKIEMPPIRQVGATFKKAPKAKGKPAEVIELPLPEDEE